MSTKALALTVTVSLLAVTRPLAAQEIVFTSGNIQVKRGSEHLSDVARLETRTILRDAINFGICFQDDEYRRMPLTYYHPRGPLGLTLEKFNWFSGPVNTYAADARLPAALVGLGASPAAQLAALWSEPPIGVIGLEAGTPASYARPFQHFHVFEPTQKLIDLHELGERERFFHFVPDAQARGAQVRIRHGAPRKQLAEHGPRRFYHVLILEACSGENGEKIFLELFTREGIAQCMEHLVDDGILCVHTSHRFVDLPPILAAIGRDLKLAVRRGHDQFRRDGARPNLAEAAHYTSEWVLLARDRRVLDAVCKTPPGYEEALRKLHFPPGERYWEIPEAAAKAWTDKGPNLLHGVLRGHPLVMRYAAFTDPLTSRLADVALSVGASHQTHNIIVNLSQMPRPLEQWLVQNQLKHEPEVEKLWR